MLKGLVYAHLEARGHKLIDLGTGDNVPVDYPDFAHNLSNRIKKNQFGILVCGSGIGMGMAANRHKNIRAALCYNVKSAKLSREPVSYTHLTLPTNREV